MWAIAAEVRKYTGSGIVRRAGQTDTHISGSCGWCGRGIVLGEGGGGDKRGRRGLRWCDNCKRIQDGCVICRKGVAGRWVLCGVCGHGGHEGCLRVWFFGEASHRRKSNKNGEDEEDEESEEDSGSGKVGGVQAPEGEGGGGEDRGEGVEGSKESHRARAWGEEVEGDDEEMEICAAVGCGHECLPRYVGG